MIAYQNARSLGIRRTAKLSWKICQSTMLHARRKPPPSPSQANQPSLNPSVALRNPLRQISSSVPSPQPSALDASTGTVINVDVESESGSSFDVRSGSGSGVSVGSGSGSGVG
eukprot:6213987-Pleurochrysis_carterae.AAC.2